MKVQLNYLELLPDLYVWCQYMSCNDDQAVGEAEQVLNFGLGRDVDLDKVDLVLLRRELVYDTDIFVTSRSNAVIAWFEKVKTDLSVKFVRKIT